MTSFKRFLAFLSSCSGLVLAMVGISNFFLAYKACSVVREAVAVTNVVELVSCPTNSLTNPTSLPSVFPSVPVPPASAAPAAPAVREPRQVAEYPYQYFLVGRRIGAYMFDRYYYDGSPCSYGRIDKIFPDRILLVGGDWIQNRFDRESSSFVSSRRSGGLAND